MAKKNGKLPYQVKEETFKGWQVICNNKEVIVIKKGKKRKLWDIALGRFACEWESCLVNSPEIVSEFAEPIEN